MLLPTTARQRVTRYWSFTRMLWRPFWSPLSASRRFAGGSVRNVRSAAAFTRSSLRATGQISRGMRRAAFELRRHVSRRSPGCRELPDEQRV